MFRPLALLCCLLVPASAHSARLFNSTANLVPLPTPAIGAVLVDLNGDGVADLLTPFGFSSGLGVSLATGRGSFGPCTVRFPGHGELFVDVGDLDGDGLIDAAGTSESNETSLFIAYGDGNGGWSDSLVTLLPGIEGTGFGDLDGDGQAELVAGLDDGTIRVYRGHADRSISLVGSWPSNGFLGSPLFVHLVGSPAVDLFVRTGTGYSVYEGNGDGSLGARTDVNLGGGAFSGALAQIDGAPGLDLLLGGFGPGYALNWRSGLGGAAFGPAQALDVSGLLVVLAATGDFNGDGKTDVVAEEASTDRRGVITFRGDGAGGFAPRVFSAQSVCEPSSLTLGDANGDLRADVAYIGTNTTGVVVGIGQLDGTFGEPQSIPPIPGRILSVAAGDFDGDGLLDAVGCDTTNTRLAFARGHGDGSFDPFVLTSIAPAKYRLLVPGQFDADANLDLVGVPCGIAGTVSFLKGQGNGTFAAPVVYFLPGPARSILPADVDGDGKLDVAMTCPTGNAIAVLHQGAATLETTNPTATLPGPRSVRYADLDADGRIDRVVTGTTQWRVELNDGAGGYTALPGQAQLPAPADLALADFDGDGRLDLAVAQDTLQPAIVHIWRGQPGGVFDSHATANLVWTANPFQPASLAGLIAQDFDGDGRVDLVAGSARDDAIAIAARGRGDRTFEAPEAYAAPFKTRNLAVGDFDQDGFDDLLGASATPFASPVSSFTFVRNIAGGVVGAPSRPGASVKLAITRLAPNPTRGAFALDLSAAAAGSARVILVSLAGRIVLDRTVTLTAGSNRVSMQGGSLRPGVYWARAEAFGQAASRKVVVLP